MRVRWPRVTGRVIKDCDHWQAAVGGIVKVHVDAGVFDGEVGFGAVARRRRREAVWFTVIQDEGVMEARLAEARAILFGMEEALKTGLWRWRSRTTVLPYFNICEVTRGLDPFFYSRGHFQLTFSRLIYLLLVG
ncbi:hypothetical protein RND81_04G149800 [Saponaria officinalis]|uniref:RNase H type-1 domain-containing protein n=1 Tax=Saponaria officinalis TaxID=3572 RepID=A0AAW1LMA1_SAPOF